MRQFSENFRALLFGEYATLNLTRISDENEFYDKQIIDSIFPLEVFHDFKNDLEVKGLHVDVGFGGGFPLLPIAKMIPGLKSVGFEARRKKADAVQKIGESLGLSNVSTYHNRVEDVLLDRDCVVTLKAVGKIEDFLAKLNVSPGIKVKVYFYKGPNLQELEKTPLTLGGFVRTLLSEYRLPSGQLRYLVSYEAKNVPRGTKKNLVKLSELN